MSIVIIKLSLLQEFLLFYKSVLQITQIFDKLVSRIHYAEHVYSAISLAVRMFMKYTLYFISIV